MFKNKHLYIFIPQIIILLISIFIFIQTQTPQAEYHRITDNISYKYSEDKYEILLKGFITTKKYKINEAEVEIRIIDTNGDLIKYDKMSLIDDTCYYYTTIDKPQTHIRNIEYKIIIKNLNNTLDFIISLVLLVIGLLIYPLFIFVANEKNPFMNLESKRLILRKMRLSDAIDLFEMRSNPLMHEFTDTICDNMINNTKNYISRMNKGLEKKKWFIWAIELKETKKVIGTISLWNFIKILNQAELGYGINPLYQNQGYMSEALELVIKFAFNNLKLNCLKAYTEEKNINSIKLLEKFNFELCDYINEEGVNNNKIYHMNVYQLKKE